jgi:transformer-2 protein
MPRRVSAPPPPKPRHAPKEVNPTNVVGVFGLSIRTTERDLEDEFGQIAPVEKVVIVYDARVSEEADLHPVLVLDRHS